MYKLRLFSVFVLLALLLSAALSPAVAQETAPVSADSSAVVLGVPIEKTTTTWELVKGVEGAQDRLMPVTTVELTQKVTVKAAQSGRIQPKDSYIFTMARRLVNTPSSALASVQTKWQTYTDERFGFKLDYPEGWYMLARDDTPGRVGAVLSFSNVPELRSTNESYGDDRIVVSVGFYLMEIDKGESLSKWIDLYEEKSRVFEVPEITILEQKVLPISKLFLIN